MLEDMNNSNEKKDTDFFEDAEPIDTIEKTVEDLKRKIQELSVSVNFSETTKESEPETDPVVFDEPDVNVSPVADEPIIEKPVVEEVIEDAEEAVEAVVETEETVEEADEEPAQETDDFKKTLDFIKSNAMTAIESTRTKIETFRQDEKVRKYEAIAKETFDKAVDKVSEAAKNVSDRIDDDTKEKLSNVCATAQDKAKSAINAAQEFVQREDVRQAVSNAKTTATDLAKKGIDTVKKYVDRSEEEDDL